MSRLNNGIVLTAYVEQCTPNGHTPTCFYPINHNLTGTHYYKNTTETPPIFFSCDWLANTGYTIGTAQLYTPPSPPAPAPRAASAPPPVYVPFSPLGLMGPLLFLMGIVASGLRKRRKYNA